MAPGDDAARRRAIAVLREEEAKAAAAKAKGTKRPRGFVNRVAREGTAAGTGKGDLPERGQQGTKEWFERAALGPLLWRRTTREELGMIPREFANINGYVRSFEPVMMEEAREGIRKSWKESLAEKSQFACSMASELKTTGGGWRRVRFHIRDQADAEMFKALCPDDGVVIACVCAMNEADPWPHDESGLDLPIAAAGLCKGINAKEQTVDFSFWISAEVDTATNPSTPGWREWHERSRVRERLTLEAFEGVRRLVRGDRGDALIGGHAVAEEGEMDARPPPMSPYDRTWFLAPAGKLHSWYNTYEALHHVRRLHGPMRQAMLKPPKDGMPRVRNVPAPPLSVEIAGNQKFVDFLVKNFNEPQLAAIKWAAAHTLRSYEREGDQSHEDLFPFTLVQGPPGTGKTQTVWGILNTLHCLLFQRYYKSIHDAIARGTSRATGTEFTAALDDDDAEWLRSAREEGEEDEDKDGGFTVRDLYTFLRDTTGVERGQTYGVYKPRILVCAPSNAAVDNLLERVITKRFHQLTGELYTPGVVRVTASDTVVSDAVGPVTTSRLVEDLIEMGKSDGKKFDGARWNAEFHKHAKFVKEAGDFIKYKERELVELTMASAEPRTVPAEGDDVEPGEEIDTRNQKSHGIIAEILGINENRNRAVTEMARLAYLLDNLGPNAHHVTRNQRIDGKADRQMKYDQQRAIRKVRAALEASFVDDAEIVFTTLTSSSRKVFRQLTHGFDTVLIDEAAQANEMATLIPFLHGARRCVLVGDPQQLPSTVISKHAQQVSFQRSLFERFNELGAEALLLSVQYRMHPEIREFPSEEFYEGRLMDSACVLKRRPEPYQQKESGLGTYRIFDAHGLEERTTSNSVINHFEAILVACLYKKIDKVLRDSTGESAEGKVSVVTPYKEQVTVIRKAFEQLCGGEGAASRLRVHINTIDGYQGQESDVIIFSTVRGSGDGGIGFLSDIRRLNVAITRAKKALYVVGRVGKLRAAQAGGEFTVWRDLIQNAMDRGCIVDDVDPRVTFADVVPVEDQERAMSKLTKGNRRGVGFKPLKPRHPENPQPDDQRVCREWLAGKCLYGSDCRFAHEKRYDAKSKKLCRDFMMGKCHRGAECVFSHDTAMGGGGGGVAGGGGVSKYSALPPPPPPSARRDGDERQQPVIDDI